MIDFIVRIVQIVRISLIDLIVRVSLTLKVSLIVG